MADQPHTLRVGLDPLLSEPCPPGPKPGMAPPPGHTPSLVLRAWATQAGKAWSMPPKGEESLVWLEILWRGLANGALPGPYTLPKPRTAPPARSVHPFTHLIMCPPVLSSEVTGCHQGISHAQTA